jgi:hypothetical protein
VLIGQVTPPALGCSVISLLNHALAVAAFGWADRDGDAVVLGHSAKEAVTRPESGSQTVAIRSKRQVRVSPTQLA